MNLHFPTALPWMTACLVVAVILGLLVRMARRRKRSPRGFQEAVKEPESMRAWDDDFQRRDLEANAARMWSDDQVVAAVKAFVMDSGSSRDAGMHGYVLRKLDTRTHPAVLALLGDAALRPRLVEPTGTTLVPEAPFNRACDLLGDAPPASVVPWVARFLEEPSAGIRRDAAQVIAKTGAAGTAPLLRKAFADEDEYVRSSALMGMMYALNQQRMDGPLRAAIFPDVLALLLEERNAREASILLPKLDEARALKLFLRPEIFFAGSPILPDVLRALHEEKAPVPRGLLLEIIAGLGTQEVKDPHARALADALLLLGRHRDGQDRGTLQALMEHPDKEVAAGAAAALLASHGMEDVHDRLAEKERSAGHLMPAPAQRHYLAVYICDAEILNGGITQYFFNSSGDTWPDALAGMKAMGFRERLAILEKALAMFGKHAPSTDHGTRQNQFAKRFRKDDTMFDELESAWYESTEVVEVFLARYVLEHAEAFR